MNTPLLRRLSSAHCAIDPIQVLTALACVASLVTTACAAAGATRDARRPPVPARAAVVATAADERNPCTVQGLRKSDADGIVVPSPDGATYVVNKEDEKGVGQIYIGRTGSAELTCISCAQQPGGPKADRYKTQPTWHPSGRWLFIPVERDTYTRTPILGLSRKYVKGQLRNGVWTNMWAVSPDGRRWVRLTDFHDAPKGTPNGFTGPAITSDGRKVVWSQIVDGNIFAYTFGKWELMLADFEEEHGDPALVNSRNITPPNMNWNEVGNFHPDDESLLLTGSVEKRAQGMDQYILNIRTNRLTNLTNSPAIWDEHGYFSPDGEKIIFMSAYPYRDNPKSSEVLSIKTEFMLMNGDGSGLTQLTHFREPGYPESNKGGIAANPVWAGDGRSAALRTLMFPDYVDWAVVFNGSCGLRPRR